MKKTQALCRHGNHDRENEQLDEVIYGISATSIRKTNKKHQSAILNICLWETRLTIAMCLHVRIQETRVRPLRIRKINVACDHNSSGRTRSPLGFPRLPLPPLRTPIILCSLSAATTTILFQEIYFILLVFLVYFLSASVDCIFMADCLLNMFLSLEWLSNVGRLSTLLTSKTSSLLQTLSLFTDYLQRGLKVWKPPTRFSI